MIVTAHKARLRCRQTASACRIAAVSARDGFLTQVYSPAPKFVNESALALIDQGDRVAAFVFSGKSAADEAEVLRRTEGGRDSNREPFPIPADVYAKIHAEPARPLLAMVLWRIGTANDPTLLAIAHAVAAAFFKRCGERT